MLIKISHLKNKLHKSLNIRNQLTAQANISHKLIWEVLRHLITRTVTVNHVQCKAQQIIITKIVM